MKDVQATYANLKKNLDANNTAAAVEDATKLEGLFKETEGFWAPLNTKDAVNFAKSAQEDTAAVVAAVKANDMKKAQETYTTVRNNCAGCHFSHREESGKGFSIKP
jgi:iron uptake system EfeUOB component EfeO/EfeM